MQLVLIRHGQPQTGQGAPEVDPPLTELGVAQATAAAAALEFHAPDIIVSSGMRRANQTAEPALERMNQELIIDERFSEIDFGGLPYVDGHMMKARGEDAFAAFLRDPIAAMGGDEESMRARVLAGVEALFQTYAGKTVAVYCHAIPISLITSAALNAPGGGWLVRYHPAFGSLTRFYGKSITRMALQSFGESQHVAELGPTM